MSEEEVRSFFMHWLDFFETYFLLVLLEIPFLFKCISWICLRSFFKHLLDLFDLDFKLRIYFYFLDCEEKTCRYGSDKNISRLKTFGNLFG